MNSAALFCLLLALVKTSAQGPCPCNECTAVTIPGSNYLALPSSCAAPPCDYALSAVSLDGSFFHVVVTDDESFQSWRNGNKLYGFAPLISEMRATCYFPPETKLAAQRIWTIIFCDNLVSGCQIAEKIDYSFTLLGLALWGFKHPVLSIAAILFALLIVVVLCCLGALCCCSRRSRPSRPPAIEMVSL